MHTREIDSTWSPWHRLKIGSDWFSHQNKRQQWICLTPRAFLLQTLLSQRDEVCVNCQPNKMNRTTLQWSTWRSHRLDSQSNGQTITQLLKMMPKIGKGFTWEPLQNGWTANDNVHFPSNSSHKDFRNCAIIQNNLHLLVYPMLLSNADNKITSLSSPGALSPIIPVIC